MMIAYTYDPLNRLTEANYSVGTDYAYAYDAVGNRTALTETTALTQTVVTTYTYDAANRLTGIWHPVSGFQPYAWDDRGNLTHDGVFTYTYNAAGRMVRAESVTATLLYTYTVDGLRIAQDVDGVVTSFAWDWATGVPEMLSDGASLYLVGHDTLGWEDTEGWTYVLPDALGSVRQTVDASGAVVEVREWTPYGVEVAGAQGGLGYAGEWFDAGVDLEYLRARWYDAASGRFDQRDIWPGEQQRPATINPFLYALSNPLTYIDPTGYVSHEWWERMLQDDTWRTVLFDSAARHNITAMTDQDFSALMAAIVRIESGAVHHNSLPYESVVQIKSWEIWYNTTPLPRLFNWIGEDFILGYQTEGISNISIETIANLRQGLVPDADGNFQQTDLKVYDYVNQPLPEAYPFPGLTIAQQTNLLNAFSLTWRCHNDLDLLLQLVRQDQNIEYLAANLEAGAMRAGWEGSQPTAEVLTWWNFRGIVTMIADGELKTMINDAQGEHQRWLQSVQVIQTNAKGYWDNLASWIMQEAVGLLSP